MSDIDEVFERETEAAEPPPPPPPLINAIPPGGKITEETKRVYHPPQGQGGMQGIQGPLIPMQRGRAPGIRHYGSSIGSAIEVINQTADEALTDDTKRAWTLQIYRVGPLFWGNEKLQQGRVDELAPMRWEEVENYIQEKHGHGRYRVELVDEGGKKAVHVLKSVGTEIPPRTPPRETTSNGGGTTFRAGNGTHIEADPVIAARSSEALARAEMARLRTENELKREKKRMAEEERREQEAEERRSMQPEIAQLKSEMDRRDVDMKSTLKDIMHTVTDAIKEMARRPEPPRDDGKQTAMILESIRESGKQTAQMMMEMVKAQAAAAQAQAQAQVEAAKIAANAPKDTSQMDTIKLVLAESAKNAQIQLESAKIQQQQHAEAAKASAAKSDKLLEMFFANKMTESSDKLEMALKFMERGENRQRQMYETIERIREREGSGDGEGINWGKLAENGLAAISGFMSMRQQSALPPPPSAVEQRFAPISMNPVAVPGGQQLRPMQPPQGMAPRPAPVVQQPIQRPARPPQPVAVSPNVTPIRETPQAAPAPIINPVFDDAVVASADSPIRDHVGAAVVQQHEPAPVQVAPAPAQAPTQPESEEYLTRVVTAAMEVLKTDLAANPAEYEWVEMALAKWNKSFLDTIAAIPDSPDRDAVVVQMIAEKCDPAVWNEIATQLYSDTDNLGAQRYQRFVTSIQDLINEIRLGQSAVA